MQQPAPAGGAVPGGSSDTKALMDKFAAFVSRHRTEKQLSKQRLEEVTRNIQVLQDRVSQDPEDGRALPPANHNQHHQQHQPQEQQQQYVGQHSQPQHQSGGGRSHMPGGGHVVNQQVNTTGEQASTVDTVEGMTTGSRESQMAQVVSETPVTTDSLRGGGSSAAASSHGVLASVSVSQGPRSVTSAGFHSVGGGGGGGGSNAMNITGAVPPHMGGGVMGGVGGGGGSAGTWEADATISAMHETSAGSAVQPTSNDTGNIPVQAPSPYHVARRGAGGETGAAHRTTPGAASGANIANADVGGDLPPHQAHHQQQQQGYHSQQGQQHPAGSLPPPEVPPLPLGQRGVSSSSRGVGAGAGGHSGGGGVSGNPIEAFAANADYSAMSPHLGSAMASHNASALHPAGAAMPHPEAMAQNAPPGVSAQQAAGAPFHTSGDRAIAAGATAAGDGNLLPMNAAQPLQGHPHHQAADPHHPPQQQHQAPPGLVALMSHGGTASVGIQGQSHHSANNREGLAVAPGPGNSGPGVVQGHTGGGAPPPLHHHQLAPNMNPGAGVGAAGVALVPLGGDVHGQDHGHGIVAAPSYTDSHFSEYVAKLQAQTDAAEKKATMLAKTLVKTLRQRTELEECAGRMSSEVEEIRATMAGLQSARVDRDEAMAELDAMRDVAARRTAAVERAEAVARQAATALEQHVKDERDARRQQQRDKETMLTQVTQQLSDVVAERDELKQELFEMQQECTNASDELAAQVEHNQDLHDRVTHLESELKAERVRRLTTERQVLTAPSVLLPNANAVPSAAAHPGGGDGNRNSLRTASGRYASPIDVEAERDGAASTQQMRQQRKRIGGVASPDARDPYLATVAPGDATATDDDDANAAMDRRSEMTAAMAAIRAAGGVDAQIAALEARHRDILTTLTTEHEADVSRKSARIDSLQSQTAELRRRVKDLEHTLSTTKRDAAVASRNATTHSFAAQMARQRLLAVKQDALRVQQVLTTSRADASAIYDEAEEDGNDTVRLFVDRVAQDLANVSHFLVRLRMMEVEAAPIVAPPPSLPVSDSQQTGAAATASESRGQNSRHGSGGDGRRGGGHGGGRSLVATSLGSKKKTAEEERRSAPTRSSKSRTQSSSIPPHASDSPTEDSTSDSQSAIAAHTDTSTTTPTRRGGGGKHNNSSSRHSDPSGLTHTPLKADGKIGRKLRGLTEHDDTNDTILQRPSSLTRHDPPHASSEPRATYRSVSGGAGRRAPPPPPPPPPSPPKRSGTSSPQRMSALDEVAAVLRSDPAHAPRPASPAHLTAVAATARTVSPTSVSSVRTATTSHLSRGGLSRGGLGRGGQHSTRGGLAKAVFSGTTSERSGSRGTASYPGLFETSPTRINVDGTPTDDALNAPPQADVAPSTHPDDAATGNVEDAGAGAAERAPPSSGEKPTTAAAKLDGSKRKILQSPSEEPSLSAPPMNDDLNETSKPEDSKAALAQVAAVLASDPSARRTPTTPSLPPAGDNAAVNDAHRRTQQDQVPGGRLGGGRAAPPAPSFDDDDEENDTPPSSPLPPADARTATVAPHLPPSSSGGDDLAMMDRRAGQQQQQGSTSHRTSPLFGADGIGAPRSDFQQDRTGDDIRHSSSSHGQAEEEGLVHTEDIMTRTAEPDMDDDEDEDEVTDRFNDDDGHVRYDPHNHHDRALQGGVEELDEGEESAGGLGYEGFAAANAPIDLPTPTGSEP